MVAKEPGADPEFVRWVGTQKFTHPQTRNDVKFQSLPAPEQAKIRTRWQQAKQQADAQRFQKSRKRTPTTDEQLRREDAPEKKPDKRPSPREPERSQEDLAKDRKKFLDTPTKERPNQWVPVDNGNRLWGSAKLGDDAQVKDSRIAGTVDGSAKVERSEVGGNSRVGGEAQVIRSSVDDMSVVEDSAKVSSSSVSNHSRIRGDTEIIDATIKGGTWDGQKLQGNGGTYHKAWDQDTLDILSSIEPRSAVFGYRAPEGTPGPGDGPLQSMVRFLEDGGRTKGWLGIGKELDQKKLSKRIQRHIYDSYDRKDPWLGRGASFLDDISEEDFGKLMKVAQRETDERQAKRRKKAMLYQLTKTALDRPDMRARLMPLVRLGRDARVASGALDLREQVIRTAFESADPNFKAVLVRCVVAADQAQAVSQKTPMVSKTRSDLVRMAYNTKEPKERRALLARIQEVDQHVAAHEEVLGSEILMTAAERQTLIRVAYETTDASRRRRILSMLKEAKYSPGFMKYVEKQKWKHPQTGNDVQFVSLPTEEQKKIHEQWKAGKKDWAQKFKPEGLSEETLLTPEKFDQLKKGDRLWVSYAPYAAHEVVGHEKTPSGKPVIKAQLPNPKTGEMQERFLHKSSATNPNHEIHVLPEGAQPKDPKAEAKSEKPKSAPAGPGSSGSFPETDKHEDKPGVPGGAQEFLDVMNSSGASWMNSDGLPGQGAQFGEEDAPFSSGAVIEIAEGGYAPVKFKVLADKLVAGPDGAAMMVEALPGQSMEGPTLIPVGSKYEPKKMKHVDGPKKEKAEPKKEKKDTHVEVPETPNDRHTEAPKGAPEIKGYEIEPGHTVYLGGTPLKVTEAVSDPDQHGQMLTLDNGQKVNTLYLDGPKESPSWSYATKHPSKAPEKKTEEKAPEKKTEAPKPSGKHKDRKELVSKGRPDTAEVGMTPAVRKTMMPDGLDEEARKKTEEGLKKLTYGTLKKLDSNVQKAVEDPEGAYAQALAESGYTPGDLSEMNSTIKSLLKAQQGRKYNKTVLDVANKYDLESEDADELYEFHSDKPGRGKSLTPEQIKQKFLAKASPDTRDRMQGMGIDDFMAMYNAIMADEDEEEDLS